MPAIPIRPPGLLAALLSTGLLLAGCATSTPPAATAAAPITAAAPAGDNPLRSLAQAEVPAYMATLQGLVGIESGSRDLEGLQRIADVVAGRLRQAGMQVEQKPTQAPDFHPQLKGARLGPMVYGKRSGTGTKKVLLIAHMDTVYPRGMGAKQPFRVDGDRAYGLGIADDKVAQGQGLALRVLDRATGGGTDAAFAGLRPKGGVLESFGLRGFGGHSNDDEYVMVSNIAPRLALAVQMVRDTGSGKVAW